MQFYAYLYCMWEIEYTKEYENWFSSQDEENKIVINAKVIILSEFVPIWVDLM